MPVRYALHQARKCLIKISNDSNRKNRKLVDATINFRNYR